MKTRYKLSGRRSVSAVLAGGFASQTRLQPTPKPRNKRKARPTSDTREEENSPPLGTPCHYCNQYVAPADPDQIKTAVGAMHGRCFDLRPVAPQFRGVVEGIVERVIDHFWDGLDKGRLQGLLDGFRTKVGTNGQARQKVAVMVRMLKAMRGLASSVQKSQVVTVCEEAIRTLEANTLEYLRSRNQAIPCIRMKLAVGKVAFIRRHSPREVNL